MKTLIGCVMVLGTVIALNYAMAARQALTVQDIGVHAGPRSISWSNIDANSDGYFPNWGGRVLLVCKNGAGAKTITIVSVADEYGRSGDLTMTCGVDGNAIAGPFKPSLWNQSTGYVHFNIADGASLYFAAVRYTP